MSGVRTFIFGRPRHLLRDRRASPTYTLIWEEPPKLLQLLDRWETFVDADGDASSDRGVIDLRNAGVMASSVILHHIDIDITDLTGLDATFKALALGVPGSRNQQGNESPVTGTTTVAEVAVPLHIALAREIGSQCTDPNDVRIPSESITNQHVSRIFRIAIDRVRRLQSGYHIIAKHPVTLLTEELLPPIIPYVIRTEKMIRDKVHVDANAFFVHAALSHVVREPELRPSEVNGIPTAEHHAAESPLFSYLDLRREADVALYRSGNTRTAVIMIAVAAEELLNTVLMCMRWEEKTTPEESVKSWPIALVSRIKTSYSNRLGGSWDMSGKGAVGEWSRNTAAVRHRVVHAGYSPTSEEASKAIQSTSELLTFIGNRLTSGANLSKYPRTATLLLGKDGIKRRRRLPKWLKELQEDPTELNWIEIFSRWYDTHSRLLGDVERPRQSSVDGSWLIAVSHPGQDIEWVAHDRRTRQAARVEFTLSDHVKKSVEFFTEKIAIRDSMPHPQESLSMAFTPDPSHAMRPLESWVEEYSRIPLMGVMVDRSDFGAS